MDDLVKLEKLISTLRAARVLYYKSESVELILEGGYGPREIVPLSEPIGAPQPTIPEAIRKLNPNYAHPSLMKFVNPDG